MKVFLKREPILRKYFNIALKFALVNIYLKLLQFFRLIETFAAKPTESILCSFLRLAKRLKADIK